MTDNQFPPGEDGSATGADLGGRSPREVPPAGNDTEATVVMARRPPPVEIGDVLGHTYRV